MSNRRSTQQFETEQSAKIESTIISIAFFYPQVVGTKKIIS